MRIENSRILSYLAVSIGLIGACETAGAQVDEIVITRGFRSEALADSASSASVVDVGVIEARSAEHLESVLATTANVTMSSGASRGRFVQIRGIGDLEQFVDPKHYPSVGVSIDGIDLGGLASAAMLFDVDQVQVLRGPQGTAYGAGALAGRIDIASRAPAETFDAYLDAGAGAYGLATLGFAAGGPLAERLNGRIAVQQLQGDGYFENAWLGRDDTNGFDESTVRARLSWAPTDRASLDLTGLRFSSDNGYDAYSLDNTRVTLSDEPGRDNLDLSALGLIARFEPENGVAFEARLNWLDSKVDYGFDEDWTYVGICDGTLCDPVFDYFSNTDRYTRMREDRSIDLRWLGQRAAGDRGDIRYVVGLYAQDRDESLARQYYGPFASEYESNRTAIYAEVQAPLSGRFDLTVGFRRERFDDDYFDSNTFASASDDTLSSGEISLSVAVAEQTTLFATLARGNKPGGVNTEASSVQAFVQPRFQG